MTIPAAAADSAEFAGLPNFFTGPLPRLFKRDEPAPGGSARLSPEPEEILRPQAPAAKQPRGGRRRTALAGQRPSPRSRPGLHSPGMLPWAQKIDSLAEQSGFAGVI